MKTKRYKFRNKSNKIKFYQKGGNNFIDSDFERNYEENLRKVMEAITEYSGKHSIDRTSADKFISSQASPIRIEAAKNLIDNTIYISLQEVYDIIGELIDKFYSQISGTDTIYLYTGKPEKSFYFLCVIALKHIREKGLKQPIFIKNITEEFFTEARNSPIIILDDVSYSGAQLSNWLSGIYLSLDKKGIQQPNIYVLLVALNDNSKFKLSHIIKGSEQIISPFKLIYLDERCYQPIISKIGIEKYFYMLLLFSPWTVNASTPYVSIYLDHKLADDNSTFTTTLLYGQIPPSNLDYRTFFANEPFVGRVGVFDEDEKRRLISELDSKYISQYGNIKYDELLKNLINDVKTEPIMHEISFYPFINLCKNNPVLLENIASPEIKNFDYFVFMLPDNCLNSELNTEECILGASTHLLSYLEDKGWYKFEELVLQGPVQRNTRRPMRNFSELTEAGKELIPIHKKITSFKCPISWYKNGQFRMISDTPQQTMAISGGKKNKTRRCQKKEKLKKRKTKKK
jgi:hypothetical protein